jgi:glycosyltransferase involved in cell wall biosynthesis
MSSDTVKRLEGRPLLYLAPGDVSKGRVEPILWMRTCEAYARQGLDVTLVTLRLRRPDGVPDPEIWRHFGIEECFKIVTFPTRLDHDSPVWVFRLWAGAAGALVAAQSALSTILGRRRVPIVHARAPVLLSPFVALRRAVPRSRRPMLVFETHALPNPRNAWVVRGADLIVVNSERLALDIQKVFGLPKARVLHAPLPPHNPVRPRSRSAARRRLQLGDDAAVACYTGKMTRDHNAFLLQAAAETARRVDKFQFLLVGGNPGILDWTRRRVDELDLADVVRLVGFVPPSTVDGYQSAADVFVYHMPENVGIFPYTTPAKAYEYQAMLRPVVATDFPLFNEVFGEDGERAIRVMDRTPAGLAEGIALAFELGKSGDAMVERAASFVRERTWASRSAAILDALGT